MLGGVVLVLHPVRLLGGWIKTVVDLMQVRLFKTDADNVNFCCVCRLKINTVVNKANTSFYILYPDMSSQIFSLVFKKTEARNFPGKRKCTVV